MKHSPAFEWNARSGDKLRGLVRGADFRPAIWRLARDCGLAGEVWSDPEGVMVEAWGDPGMIDAFVQRLRSETPPDTEIETSVGAEEEEPIEAAPRFWLERFGSGGAEPARMSAPNAITAAAQVLKDGAVLAIKGVGGFHLACDAHNEHAVRRLRLCKGRPDAPFALMAPDLQIIRRYCSVNEAEAELLASRAAPIVILRADGPDRLPDVVAPGLATLGFVLARRNDYRTAYRLLLELGGGPLAVTSGNAPGEPQCIDNDEARRTLFSIADYGLFHDRRIVSRVDDSVAEVTEGEPRVLRRARGYAPAPIRLSEGFYKAPPILAFGGDRQSTLCLIHKGHAIISPHIGDLSRSSVMEDYQAALSFYGRLPGRGLQAAAVDMESERLSTAAGVEWAEENDCSVEWVQHHHAHIASCLAENGSPPQIPPVLGVVLDDVERGAGGELWGGVFLLADYVKAEKLAAFAPVPMLGGERAAWQPWRSALAHLDDAMGWEHCLSRHSGLEAIRFLKGKPVDTLRAMARRGIDCPPVGSCASLFDAVAAMAGVRREETSYEGQTIRELESLVDETALRQSEGYPVALTMIVRQAGGKALSGRPALSRVQQTKPLPTLDFGPMWQAILRDLEREAPVGVIAARLHLGLAAGIAEMARLLFQREGGRLSRVVVLSGGLFENRLLFELTSRMLKERGFLVMANRRTPASDGGLSLGQAAVAAARFILKRSVAR